MATKTTSKMSVSNLLPAESTKLGQAQTEMFGEFQKEFAGLIEQATREWLARAHTEQLLAADLATKLTSVRSPPDISNVYQEWMARRMDLVVEDSRHFVANTEKTMNSVFRLLSNGWHATRGTANASPGWFAQGLERTVAVATERFGGRP